MSNENDRQPDGGTVSPPPPPPPPPPAIDPDATEAIDKSDAVPTPVPYPTPTFR